MTIQSNTARLLPLESSPQLASAHTAARRVSFLDLAREMNGDAQLYHALQVPGTALLGIAADGVPLMIRLASPDVAHVLISGVKNSGKTQIVRTILASIVLYQKAREIQLLLLDPGGAAFEFLAAAPHLLGEIATTPERGLQRLRWLENEIERRESERVASPRLVVVIDAVEEFLTPGGREFQVHLARLARRGRMAGISLIVCANKPNASDLNASLRGNFPVRLVGKQSGTNDGAEKLAGRGDFILMAGGERVRFQAAYLAPQDIDAYHAWVRSVRARTQTRKSGLGDLMNRLRRVK